MKYSDEKFNYSWLKKRFQELHLGFSTHEILKHEIELWQTNIIGGLYETGVKTSNFDR